MHRKHPPTSSPHQPNPALSVFCALFAARFDTAQLNELWHARQRHRRPPLLPFADLLLALIDHVLMGCGSFQEHVAKLTGQRLSDSALSHRRQLLNWQLFEPILALVLTRRADIHRHPRAFYKGLRLLGVDGSRRALTNTAPILAGFRQAVSRRLKAAYAQINVVVLVEPGLHNPVAAAIGRAGESELALGVRLLQRLGAGDLLLADRLYGVQKIVAQLLAMLRGQEAQFLVRVRANLKARLLQTLGDGRAPIEIMTRDPQGKKQRLTLREVSGRVRGRNGKQTRVRLWTSLLEAKKYPAAELLALAVLVEVRCEAAGRGEVSVLRVSFRQTLRLVRALGTLLEIGAGIHTPQRVRALVSRTIEGIAGSVSAGRRARSCPRAVRQPVGSWPRLLRRHEWQGPIPYKITRLKQSKP